MKHHDVGWRNGSLAGRLVPELFWQLDVPGVQPLLKVIQLDPFRRSRPIHDGVDLLYNVRQDLDWKPMNMHFMTQKDPLANSQRLSEAGNDSSWGWLILGGERLHDMRLPDLVVALWNIGQCGVKVGLSNGDGSACEAVRRERERDF
jgi:hypothetical protein